MAAKRHARGRGAFEAIFTDTRGVCVEGSTSNLFWIRKGKLTTVPLASGALPGITREHLTHMLRDSGKKIHEEAIAADDLLHVDEAFLSSSIVGIVGIVEINGKRLSEAPGRVTQQLRERFDAYVDLLAG
jgi:branched-subunit amino acid aminotransferase/4-amino-4-deoxychorismate lyase